MEQSEMRDAAARVRREPPRFRAVEVRRTTAVGARLVAVTLGGDDLAGFPPPDPAASVRVLLPDPTQSGLTLPTWQGNEFLHDDGSRPRLRTFTPRSFDAGERELTVWVVLHGDGTASRWAETARPGDPAAISGPGRGYAIDADAPGHLLAGDETALAAVSQLLEVLSRAASVEVHLEIATPEGRVELPEHPGASVAWHDLAPDAAPGDALLAAVRRAELPPGTRVWAAGEAAGVQRIRRHLFDERDLPRSHATVRGYWKQGRRGT